jgi:hypothetical protein
MNDEPRMSVSRRALNGVFGIVSRIDIGEGELVADFDGREIT